MELTILSETFEAHVLPEAELERLELLALASAALIAHAERIEALEREADAQRRAA